ncbi:hypothetical protein PsYK624_016520 [Phanerochaete sordida]|uniref:SnoaL-like domain-containing protein n=1 Tax=Phanerochaete sordida TaxID=48140 RepID=A0A9P3L922_9APHY|nr:hypothetical protein PsYK624_016520 [Phanerochaete sordida]
MQPPAQHTSAPAADTLQAWSVAHIRAIFEAQSADACRAAVHATFAHDAAVQLNGAALGGAQLERAVLALLEAGGYALRVQWRDVLGVPRDEAHRDGVVGGCYVIYNVRKPGQAALFARHKFVNAVIRSGADEGDGDSRRIVQLSVASVDKPMAESRL